MNRLIAIGGWVRRQWFELQLRRRAKSQSEMYHGGVYDPTAGAVEYRGVNTMTFRGPDGDEYHIWGGPFRNCPGDEFIRVCLDVHMASQFDHDYFVMWPDFGIPKQVDVKPILDRVEAHVLAGRAVYVGCLGGIGRTGTFLSLLLKQMNYHNPVAEVRNRYLGHAVETKEQELYVDAWA